MTVDEQGREFALANGLRYHMEWTGIGHTPWRCEFRTHMGIQVGFGYAKTALRALVRAEQEAITNGYKAVA